MKIRLTLLTALIVWGTGIVRAQAYYVLKYDPPQSESFRPNSVFLVLYDNGTGLARFAAADSVIYSMPLTESFISGPDGSPDTTILVYEAGEPSLLRGTSLNRPTRTNFWFRLNPVSGTAEPWLVTVGTQDSTAGVPVQLAEVAGPGKMNDPRFVVNFFSTREPFYQNRFGPGSRGGKLSPQEKQARLFLLVVAQTYDRKIGPGTRIDARNVIETFSNVAAMLQIRIVIDTVFGENYSRTAVKSALNRLKPSSSDIVVFWYSGHGFTQMNSPKPVLRAKKYSWMDLLDPRQRPRPNPRDSAMNIEDVYSIIKAKPARFRLVVSDCCNDSIIPRKKDGVPPSIKPKAPFPPKWNWDNLYALFFKSRESLLFTAASPHQQAYTDTTRGSVFTNALLASLVAQLVPDAQAPDWRKVWMAARQQTITRVKNAKIKCPLPFQPNNTCEQVPPEPLKN